MKRSDALAPLSRDHHLALEVALRLRHTSADTAQEALARFGTYWERHGERHFDIEEQLLLPALPDDDAEWAEAAARVRREHAELRRRAGAATPDDQEALQALGGLLHDHVRFEERRLFALAEDRMSSAELEALGRRIEHAETEPR